MDGRHVIHVIRPVCCRPPSSFSTSYLRPRTHAFDILESLLQVAWTAWLQVHSAKERLAPPDIGAPSRGLMPLCLASGAYVRER